MHWCLVVLWIIRIWIRRWSFDMWIHQTCQSVGFVAAVSSRHDWFPVSMPIEVIICRPSVVKLNFLPHLTGISLAPSRDSRYNCQNWLIYRLCHIYLLVYMQVIIVGMSGYCARRIGPSYAELTKHHGNCKLFTFCTAISLLVRHRRLPQTAQTI